MEWKLEGCVGISGAAKRVVFDCQLSTTESLRLKRGRLDHSTQDEVITFSPGVDGHQDQGACVGPDGGARHIVAQGSPGGELS